MGFDYLDPVLTYFPEVLKRITVGCIGFVISIVHCHLLFWDVHLEWNRIRRGVFIIVQ